MNILRAAFAPIYFCQKITKPNCILRKAVQSTFVQKKCALNVDEIDIWFFCVFHFECLLAYKS